MKISLSTALIAATLTILPSTPARAHCQIPCGIYADSTVFAELQTHVDTIKKSIKLITELSAQSASPEQANQLVRWVNNKETHAQKIQDTVANYFLAQRIKTSEFESNKEAYLLKLKLLHQINVLAMKCKQSANAANADNLAQAITAFTKAYQAKQPAAAHQH